MRARRPLLKVAPILLVVVLAGCGSSGGGNQSGGENGGDLPTTTAVSPADVSLNEQTSGGAHGSSANGGAGSGPILTDAQRRAALCEASSPQVDAASEPDAAGSGDAKNYAAAIQGLADAIGQECEGQAKP